MNVQKIYETHKLEQKPTYYVVSTYDRKAKQWKFNGYRCNCCEQTLRTEYLATKHKCLPAKVKTKNETFLETNKIKTVTGQRWKPIQL